MGKGYRICYEAISKGKNTLPKRKHSIVFPIAIFLLAALIGMLTPVRNALDRHAGFARDTVTWKAMEELSDDLRAGEKLPDAVATFCDRVMEGG